MALRPGAKPLVDFIVEDDGSGPQLREGSMENPPSQDEINAVTVEQLDEAQKNKAPTIEQKLITLGLSIKDLKAALK